MIRRLIFTALVISLLTAPTLHGPAAAQNGPASEIIRLVNELRASLGLPPFSINPALVAAAQSHAEWMAANSSYSHTGAGGSRPQDRANAAGYSGYVSENIVGGTNMTVQGGINWWRNSSIHYRTMTSTRHSEVGAGYATNGREHMYVLVVGQPTNAPPPAANQGAAAVPQNQSQSAPAPAPVVVIPVEVAPPREDGSIVHVVQSGQTAWDIAAVYGVDLIALLELNNLPDNPILLPGDEIVIRPPDQPENPDQPLLHTVRLGDTAWSIAARYRVPLEDLLLINGLGPDPILQPGEQLIVRLGANQTPPPTPTPPTTHIVQAGETAWSIAARYGLTLDELLALNNLGADSMLFPGNELVIRQVEPATLPVPSLTTTAAVSIETAPPPTLPPAFTAVSAVEASTPTLAAATPTNTLATTTPPAAASPVLRAATMTPTPGALPETSEAAPSNDLTDTLVTIGVVFGVVLAVLAIGAAVIGNLLERRR